MEECQLSKASLPVEQVQKIVTGVQFVCRTLFVLQIPIAALPGMLMSHPTWCTNAQTMHSKLAGVVLMLELLAQEMYRVVYVVRNAMQAFNMTAVGPAASNVPLHFNPHYL